MENYSVSVGANIISIHTIYKIKTNGDEKLQVMALIAPHDNEKCRREELRSHCNIFSPVVILMFSQLQL